MVLLVALAIAPEIVLAGIVLVRSVVLVTGCITALVVLTRRQQCWYYSYMIAMVTVIVDVEVVVSAI